MQKTIFDLGLGAVWTMRQAGTETWHDATVPGSVYADLMRDGTLLDPFYRDNEHIAFELMRHDWEYVAAFDVPAGTLDRRHIVLRCEGLDTLADVTLNGVPVGHADNMHVTWEWDVKPLLRETGNELRILFHSPVNYCLAAADQSPGHEAWDAIPGMRHLRKAHCMFGWDWGISQT